LYEAGDESMPPREIKGTGQVPGTLLVFDKMLLHAGEPVGNGQKIVLSGNLLAVTTTTREQLDLDDKQLSAACLQVRFNDGQDETFFVAGTRTGPLSRLGVCPRFVVPSRKWAEDYDCRRLSRGVAATSLSSYHLRAFPRGSSGARRKR